MKNQIRKNLWQVAGNGLTDSADAAAYLVSFGNGAALVDSGTGRNGASLISNIHECLAKDSVLEYLLLTHCHFDHSGGAADVRSEFGCRVVAHELDAVYLETGNDQVTAASWYGGNLDPLPIDEKLSGSKNTLLVGIGSIVAHHWPGHSPGSVVYSTRMGEELVIFGQDVHGPIHPSLLSNGQLYQESLRYLHDMNADLLLEGHFGIIEPKEKVKEFIRSFMI